MVPRRFAFRKFRDDVPVDPESPRFGEFPLSFPFLSLLSRLSFVPPAIVSDYQGGLGFCGEGILKAYTWVVFRVLLIHRPVSLHLGLTRLSASTRLPLLSASTRSLPSSLDYTYTMHHAKKTNCKCEAAMGRATLSLREPR